MPLARWFPRPEPVEIGGASYAVSELRLRDREDLAAYVAAVAGPIEAAFDPDSPDYAERLTAAYEGGDSAWPPPLGSPGADAILYETAEGRAFFLLLALREHLGVTLEDARAMAETIDDAEFYALQRAAWGSRDDPKAAVLRLIDRHLGLPEFEPARTAPEGVPTTWEEAIGAMASKGPAWASPEAIGDLTPTQFHLVCAGGEADDSGDALPADPELRERVEKARRAFFGVPDRVPITLVDAPEDGPPTVDDEDVGEWSAAW